MNVFNLLIAKMFAQNQGVDDRRALELGLIASMMPLGQGIILTTMLAQQDATVTASNQNPPNTPIK